MINSGFENHEALVEIPEVDAGFRAIDEAISLAPEGYEISDVATNLGTICFSLDNRIIIASHKMSAPTEALPNTRIAHEGNVVDFDLTAWEPGARHNLDRTSWHLYRTEDAAPISFNSGLSLQRKGKVQERPFEADGLATTLGMAMRFGETISEAEARSRLQNP